MWWNKKTMKPLTSRAIHLSSSTSKLRMALIVSPESTGTALSFGGALQPAADNSLFIGVRMQVCLNSFKALGDNGEVTSSREFICIASVVSLLGWSLGFETYAAKAFHCWYVSAGVFPRDLRTFFCSLKSARFRIGWSKVFLRLCMLQYSALRPSNSSFFVMTIPGHFRSVLSSTPVTGALLNVLSWQAETSMSLRFVDHCGDSCALNREISSEFWRKNMCWYLISIDTSREKKSFACIISSALGVHLTFTYTALRRVHCNLSFVVVGASLTTNNVVKNWNTTILKERILWTLFFLRLLPSAVVYSRQGLIKSKSHIPDE